MSFYLTGNTDENMRKLISWAITLLVSAGITCYVMFTWILQKGRDWKRIIISISPLVFTVLVLMYAIFFHQGEGFIIKELIWCLLYGAPLVSVAVYSKIKDRLKEIIEKGPGAALIMMPYYVMAIAYFWNVKLETYTGDGYGGLGYLGIGYSAVVLYAFIFAALLVANKKRKIMWNSICLIEMLICTWVIVLSGSRGVLIAWAASSITAVLYSLFRRKWIALTGNLACVFGVVALIFLVPSSNAAIIRQFSFVSEVKNGDLGVAMDSQESDRLLGYIEENAQQGIGMVESANQMFYKDQTNNAVVSITNGSMARVYLFRLAIEEGLRSPFKGLGPMGYQVKYKIYPHNIFLEAFADFGFIGGLMFVVICLWLVFKFLKFALKDPTWGGLLIIMCTHAVRYCFSGNLYLSPMLLFAIAIVCLEKKHKEISTDLNNVR